MRILCAVDGSEQAQWGVQALEAFAEREPPQVTLVHVVDPSLLKAGSGKNPVAAKRALTAMEKAGARLLRDAERAARVALGQAATSPHTRLQTILAHGPFAKTIAKHATRTKADLILMGCRGLSDIRGFLLGSTSRQVAAITPCPLLVLKQSLTKLRRVTLAVDDSSPARRAARFLRSRVLPNTADITILTATESPVTDLAARYLSESQLAALTRPAMERAADLLDRLHDDFLKEGYAVATVVRMDHVIDTIVKQVEADRSDLLVIGARDLTKSERLHLGSVSETLLRHAPCSVLIVRGVRG